MKNSFPLLIYLILASLLMACTEKDSRNLTDEEPMNNFELSGYYYDGYLDEREQLDEQIENDYYYYMDHYWEEYHNASFIMLQEEEEKEENPEREKYTDFFDSIDGLTLYSLPSLNKTIHNGDYITIHIDSPIAESYPAKVMSVSDVIIQYKREQ